MAETPRGYTMQKDDYLKRLRRIEGQIRGLQRMVENDEYCIDILTQVSAATKALQSVAVGLLDEHMAPRQPPSSVGAPGMLKMPSESDGCS